MHQIFIEKFPLTSFQASIQERILTCCYLCSQLYYSLISFSSAVSKIHIYTFLINGYYNDKTLL